MGASQPFRQRSRWAVIPPGLPADAPCDPGASVHQTLPEPPYRNQSGDQPYRGGSLQPFRIVLPFLVPEWKGTVQSCFFFPFFCANLLTKPSKVKRTVGSSFSFTSQANRAAQTSSGTFKIFFGSVFRSGCLLVSENKRPQLQPFLISHKLSNFHTFKTEITNISVYL